MEAQRSWVFQGDPGRDETQSQAPLSPGSSLHISYDSVLSFDFNVSIGKLLLASWLPMGVNLLGVWANSWVNKSLGFLQKREGEKIGQGST